MTKILKSTLILLFISSLQGFPQKKAEVWRYEGPRVGIDLSRFLMPYMQKGKRNGWEIQADVPYKGNFFPTFEFGMQWFDDQRDGFHYLNNGTYARLGVDMNIVKFESLKDHDLLLVGARYGYSVFNQEADGISYTNYWGSITSSVPRRTMNAHWAELVFGMKGELFSNFFLGWSLRAKFPLSITNDSNINPYIIPGIGKITGGTAFDFSLGVYYKFPIFQTKTLPKPIKMGGNTHPGENDGYDPNNPGSSEGSRPGMGGLRSLRGGEQ
jgi:hypothetical protein